MPVKSTSLLILPSQLFGASEHHVVALPNHVGVKVHQAVLEPLGKLIKAAQSEGFDLRVASGFRDIHRQLLIWNKKCCGKTPIFDRQGNKIDISHCTSLEKIEAILHWSALPGASRHHWGTECDIYDAKAIPLDYQLQLQPAEYVSGGWFSPMMEWLCAYLARSDAPDFYRPYSQDTGGVAPEPWHISYRPVANRYQQHMSLSLLREYLQQFTAEHYMEERQTLMDNLESLYLRFVQLTDAYA
jgi:LAS superfamily LD-carboxypeptidase LdcB